MTISVTPELPVALWDGECGFCRRWIGRWRERTAGRVQFYAYQTVSPQFLAAHDIAVEDLAAAMHFVDEDGAVYRGAAAVFAALRRSNERRYAALDAAYRRVPGFSFVADAVYRFIARHRAAAGRVSKLLMGD